MKRNVLVLSENAKVREHWGSRLRERGDSVTLAASTAEAVRVVKNVAVDVAVIEARHVTPAIKSLRTKIQRLRPGIRVVVLSAFGSIRTSTDLLRFGHGDFLLAGDEVLDLLSGPPADAAPARDGAAETAAIGALIQTLDVLVGLLEIRDRHFAGSAHRTLRLVQSVAEEMGLDEFAVQEVLIGTLLRDLGKVGLEPEVLDAEGEYTVEQWERMKEHVEGSVRLLEHIDFPWKVLPIIRHHHERYDGRGYPDGLKGREIPLGARILTAVDTYVAMVSPRPHREAIPFDETVEILERQAGSQLDPEVVEILIRVVDRLGPEVYSAEAGDVLVVEPEEEFRSVLKMRLLNEGLHVREVDCLEAGVIAATEQTPGLALVDAGPTGEDGLHFARTLREISPDEPIPVVLTTRSDDPVLRLRALRQGAEDLFDRSGNLEELVARVLNVLAREAARHSGARVRRRRGISGNLETFALPDVVQVLAMGMKTAHVALCQDPHDGDLWFRDGALVHASIGNLQGATAFFGMLRWRSGEFTIEHGVAAPKTTIDDDAMYLVIEGLRQIDENPSGDRAAS